MSELRMMALPVMGKPIKKFAALRSSSAEYADINLASLSIPLITYTQLTAAYRRSDSAEAQPEASESVTRCRNDIIAVATPNEIMSASESMYIPRGPLRTRRAIIPSNPSAAAARRMRRGATFNECIVSDPYAATVRIAKKPRSAFKMENMSDTLRT